MINNWYNFMIAMDLNSVSCVTYCNMQKVRFTFFFFGSFNVRPEPYSLYRRNAIK